MSHTIIAILTSIIATMLIAALYYYYVQWKEIEHAGIIRLDSCPFRTGDLIWMKATDNNYAPLMACRFTHMGVIVRDPHDGRAYIYEAAYPDLIKLQVNQRSRGIFWTDAITRIRRYKGHCYLQRIEQEPSALHIARLMRFIHATKNAFVYNDKPMLSAIRQGLGLQHMTFHINCGELVRLALIQLGILPNNNFDEPAFHILWFLQDINKHCAWPHRYGPLYRLIDSPLGHEAQIACHH